MFLSGRSDQLQAGSSMHRWAAASSALGAFAVPPLSDPRARLADLPLGDEAGATLRYMRSFVDQAIADPAQATRNQALALYQGLPPRDYLAEAAAAQAFVRDQIRYVRDPVETELVQAPQRTLQVGQGDCDDKATLLAALLKATGHPVRFVALALNGGPLSHVLVETKVGSDWHAAETIIPVPFGWYPPGVTSSYVLKV